MILAFADLDISWLNWHLLFEIVPREIGSIELEANLGLVFNKCLTFEILVFEIWTSISFYWILTQFHAMDNCMVFWYFSSLLQDIGLSPAMFVIRCRICSYFLGLHLKAWLYHGWNGIPLICSTQYEYWIERKRKTEPHEERLSVAGCVYFHKSPYSYYRVLLYIKERNSTYDCLMFEESMTTSYLGSATWEYKIWYYLLKRYINCYFIHWINLLHWALFL